MNLHEIVFTLTKENEALEDEIIRLKGKLEASEKTCQRLLSTIDAGKASSEIDTTIATKIKTWLAPNKEVVVCPECKGYSVVPGPCGLCNGNGSILKGKNDVLEAIDNFREFTCKVWNDSYKMQS